MKSLRLRPLFNQLAYWGVRAALLGPLVLAVPQCASQNDHPVWDSKAWNSWLENVGGNYKWEHDRIRDAFEWIGDALPGGPK